MNRSKIIILLPAITMQSMLFAFDKQFFEGVGETAKNAASLAPCAMLVHGIGTAGRLGLEKIKGNDTEGIMQSWLKNSLIFSGVITSIWAFCDLYTALDERSRVEPELRSRYSGKATVDALILAGFGLVAYHC